ncbi:MAG TPA: enoyl-CoA hydratase [Acidimicrobiales bacterium]|nr:enoyl-CoA hydratase [Acidimicrobiales bacterium]
MEMIRVDVRSDERVAVVTLDDPDRRNALNATMVGEIVATFDELEADDAVGAVVVTGAPPAFCAGADLGNLGEAKRQGLLSIYEGFLRVGRSSLPTLAAVNGAAVGAGMNLAMVCDVRMAARRARFDTRFIDLGLHPGGGHTWMLRNAVGPHAAAAMVLFGQVLDGEEAERRGLVWRCVDDDALLDEAVAVAARAASGPKELVTEVKASLRDMAGISVHADAVERELGPQVWSTDQPWFAERLAALKAKVSKR